MAESLSLKFYVDPTEAILAGNTVVGAQIVLVTLENLRPLPDELRAELAIAFRDGSLGTSFIEKGMSFLDLPAREPTFEEVQRLLEYRLKMRIQRRREEEERVQTEEAAKRDAEAHQQEKKREAEKHAAELLLKLHAWVKANGDDSQKSRLREGLLPTEEIIDAVAEESFDELDSIEQYTRMRIGDICGCSCATDVTFIQRPTAGLSSEKYEKLVQIRENAPKGATIMVMDHIGKCPSCACEDVIRHVAHVGLSWNGAVLKRKYLL